MVTYSIIIPAYNEEKRIGNTLREYGEYLKKNKISSEILVILNGCKDNTLKIVKKKAKTYKQIKYKNIKEPIGKGGALIEGFKLAKGKYISYVDADNSTKVYQLEELFNELNGYDGVIGSRWLEDSVIMIKQSLSRQVASRGFNFLVRKILKLPFKDTQAAAKVFKKTAIKKILPTLKLANWGIDVSILYSLSQKKYKIKEVPICWQDDPNSTLKMQNAIPNMFWTVMKLRFKK